MELIIGFLGIFFVLYALYFFITLIISVIMGVVKAIINAIISLFTPRKKPIIQIENKKTNFLPVIKEEKKCISTIGRVPYCEQCEHCKDDGKLIFCEKANNKVIGHYAGGEYKYRHFIVNGYKPEWCPLTKGLVVKEDNVRKERLSDKFIPHSEPKKEDDKLTISFGWTSHHTDRYGRNVLDSIDNVEVNFDETCSDEIKKKNIIEFLNEHCKYSSFYVDENYGIYCLEKEEKSIDVKIDIKEEALPEYINFIRVPGHFSLKGGNIKTLKGCPKYVGFGFDCSYNKIETFENGPVVVNFKEKKEDLTKWEGQAYDSTFSLDCSHNMIASFENFPEVKKGSVICSENKIKSFKGIQPIINGSLICDNNEISSFDYLPQISGTFNGSNNIFAHIDEEKIKDITKCSKVYVKGCDKKVNSINLTKKFLEDAIKKYGYDNFEFVSNTYWGERPTTLQTKNGLIRIKCKKHDFYFETYPKEFLLGEKMCPLCKMEKYGFNKKNDDEFTLAPYTGSNVYFNNNCKNEELISKICAFINTYVSASTCIFYINADYSIDIESRNLDNLNRNNVYYGVTVTINNGKLPDYITFGDALVNSFSVTNVKTNAFTGDVIEEYPKITSFKGCPKRVFGDFICKNESLSSFIDMPLFIGGLFDFSNNSFDDEAWEYAKDNVPSEIIGDYKHTKNKFIKYRKELS